MESNYVRTLTPPAEPAGRGSTGPAKSEERSRENEAGYQRVVGRRGFSGQSVYLGDEFLLCVNGGVFQETYRRFYYRDIQAVLLRRSGSSVAPSVIVLLVAVGIALGWMPSYYAPAAAMVNWWLFWSVVLAMCVAKLVWSILEQGRCVCYIQTPVSIQRLPVTTVRAAKRLLAALSPRVEAAQASPSPVPSPQSPGASAIPEHPAQ